MSGRKEDFSHSSTRSRGRRALDFVTGRGRSRGSSGDSPSTSRGSGKSGRSTQIHRSSSKGRRASAARRFSATINSVVEGVSKSGRKSIFQASMRSRRTSMGDVAVQAKQHHQHKAEMLEIKRSVAQFRNPVFDNSIARSSGSVLNSTSRRLRNGFYR